MIVYNNNEKYKIISNNKFMIKKKNKIQNRK